MMLELFLSIAKELISYYADSNLVGNVEEQRICTKYILFVKITRKPIACWSILSLAPIDTKTHLKSKVNELGGEIHAS